MSRDTPRSQANRDGWSPLQSRGHSRRVSSPGTGTQGFGHMDDGAPGVQCVRCCPWGPWHPFCLSPSYRKLGRGCLPLVHIVPLCKFFKRCSSFGRVQARADTRTRGSWAELQAIWPLWLVTFCSEQPAQLYTKTLCIWEEP